MATTLVSSVEECNNLQYPVLIVSAGVGDTSGSRWTVTDRENLAFIFGDAVEESYDGNLVIIEVGDRVPKEFWNTNQCLGP
ncbi:hypothetical protein GW943_03225 [Candidatus Parcubacteria bacterium]|uniref:Uncharacterized protein n=1 Tax=Candidatus Kaiserbacteria bacterium CG10_big_fil_rev_8_21_14_0_10_47_16 TaxID=1974608 RepID=A0A2H0UEM8_9BACT|nr:hypothetical protein [Candidatus Parcubacteria bacterium]PIR84847.1 MAG: hypothetical protein COU16_00465 [Candidatus Kaiserbacteria bacterium CG10_big_fil_rev_8_21_14_0_10_47_16]